MESSETAAREMLACSWQVLQVYPGSHDIHAKTCDALHIDQSEAAAVFLEKGPCGVKYLIAAGAPYDWRRDVEPKNYRHSFSVNHITAIVSECCGETAPTG